MHMIRPGLHHCSGDGGKRTWEEGMMWVTEDNWGSALLMGHREEARWKNLRRITGFWFRWLVAGQGRRIDLEGFLRSSVKNLPWVVQGHFGSPLSRKIPHAAAPLSCSTLKPVLCNKRICRNEKPVHTSSLRLSCGDFGDAGLGGIQLAYFYFLRKAHGFLV